MKNRLQCALFFGLAAAVFSAEASASPNGGSVSGKVELPTLGLGDAPDRNRGFLDRSRHPLKAPAAFDPRPEMIVVLSGGPVDREDTKPLKRPVTLRLIGESFEVPVLPIIKGTEVELKNQTKKAPGLYCPTDERVLRKEESIFNPDASRLLKNLDREFVPYEIKSRDSAHLRGVILPLPHSYFARVDKNGQFEVVGVPAGEWHVRIWYDKGWLKAPDPKVVVKPKAATTVTYHLPAKLVVAAPGSEGN